MSRSFIYLSIFCVAALVLLIPPLSMPGQGIAFVFEELASLGLAGLIFTLCLSPVRTRIKSMSVMRKNGLQKKIYGREFKDVLLGTALIFTLICLPSYLYFRVNGLPVFYRDLLEYKETVRRTNRPSPNIPGRGNQPGKRPPPPYRPMPLHAPDQIPFWPYALRILSVSTIALSSIYAVEEFHAGNQYLIAQKNLQQEQLKEQAILQANVLKKQLNPHFMFNTLNVLSGLIHEDIDKSERFINELSKVYRYAIEHSEIPWSSLYEEINFIQSYTFLLKIRFDDKLKVDIEIDKDLMDHQIPAMTLELLLENAIKHNEVSKKSPLFVKIYISNGALMVDNNYQPIEARDDSTGIGLNNLNRRLELLGQEKAIYMKDDNTFRVSIPLKKPL
ncbi:MAG: histidine kinase [Bacteroidota bacterium]